MILPALLGAALGGAGSCLAPTIIARLPEPDPEPESESESEESDEPEEAEEPRPPKEPYVAIAAGPGLAWRAGVAGAVAAGLMGWFVGWAWPLVVLVALVPVSVALAVVDWRTRLLPTRLIAPTYAVTVGLVLLTWLLAGPGSGSDLLRPLVGWAGAGGLYFLLWLVYPAGMGYGDVRLSGILGIALGYLGWAELVVGIYGGFLLGGVLGGLLSLLRRVDRKGYPFGPFMLLGALVGVVTGPPVIDWLIA